MTRAWSELVDDAVELRHRLHRAPELTWSEHRTAKEIRQRLDALGIPWRTCADTGTNTCADTCAYTYGHGR